LKNLAYISVLIVLISSCDLVQFEKQQLYAGYEDNVVEKIPEAIIFDDAEGTMWNSLSNCGNFEISKDIAYKSNSSIKISWDKSKGCEWLGFGNSFSNWNPIDMSELIKSKALTFYVRSQGETVGALPIVASLEDFSGGGSYHFIDTKKYLHGLQIDTVWRQVIVPLWDFPIRPEEVDIYSIKQMKFQLEGGGSYYLDAIKVIDYSPSDYAQFRKEVEAMKPKGELNQVVFNPSTFEFDVWGTEKNPCQDLSLVKNQIVWNFNSKDCSWAKWGINWNGWYQVNMRGVPDQSYLEIKMKVKANTAFKIILEDYRYHRAYLYDQFASPKDIETTAVIELSQSHLDKSNMELDQIKQLLFEGSGKGSVEISSIKIIKK
jgi:hypothetical protein